MCFRNKTVKCLLIIPNAESALNEEAGRLLLENYDDYAKHARLMTKIHASAKPSDVSFTEPSSQNGPSSSSSCSAAPQSTSSSQSKKSISKDTRDGLIKSEDKNDEIIDTKGERKTDVKDSKSDQNDHEPMTNVHSAATSPLGVSNSINEGISLKKNTGDSTITVTPRKRAAEGK
ncbi:37_t:CDS:1, partial [Paraglomus occultum]